MFRSSLKKYQITSFVKIRPVGTELFHADRRTDRHDEVNSRFSQCANSPENDKYLSECTLGTRGFSFYFLAVLFVHIREVAHLARDHTRWRACIFTTRGIVN
jgi:hypothetical protein